MQQMALFLAAVIEFSYSFRFYDVIRATAGEFEWSRSLVFWVFLIEGATEVRSAVVGAAVLLKKKKGNCGHGTALPQKQQLDHTCAKITRKGDRMSPRYMWFAFSLYFIWKTLRFTMAFRECNIPNASWLCCLFRIPESYKRTCMR